MIWRLLVALAAVAALAWFGAPLLAGPSTPAPVETIELEVPDRSTDQDAGSKDRDQDDQDDRDDANDRDDRDGPDDD